jgi:hypothetical protein
MLEPTAEIRHQIAIERVAALRRSAQLPMRRKIVVAAVLARGLSTGAADAPLHNRPLADHTPTSAP